MQLASSAAPSATTFTSTPVVVTLPGGRSAVQVACGARHTCVLMDNRVAVCAGYNLWCVHRARERDVAAPALRGG